VHPPEDLETEENGEEGVANQNATRMDALRLREAEKPHEGRHVAGDGGLQPADLRDLGAGAGKSTPDIVAEDGRKLRQKQGDSTEPMPPRKASLSLN
jgi:hypothetical protein